MFDLMLVKREFAAAEPLRYQTSSLGTITVY